MKNKFLLLASCFLLLASVIFAQVNPGFNYTQTCYGNQTTLVASSILPDTSIASWQWDLDNNGTYDISGKTIIYLFSSKDTNAVKLKITPKTGTADSITQNVIIDALPQVNFFASNLCQGKTATYISQSTIPYGSITQYKWDFNNDGVYDATGDTATYTCGPAQTYITKLFCVSNKGCAAFTQKVTTVYPNPVASIASSGSYSTCVNTSRLFTNISTVTNLDFYLWDFGDGNQVTTSGDAAHTYSVAASYTVTLIAVTQSGCRDTTSNSSFAITPLPAVSVTASGPTTFCAGNNVTLDAATGGGIASYLWSNNSANPHIIVSASGNYDVTVTDGGGCTNTASATVVVNPLPVVSITANGSTVLHPNSNVILVANGASNYQWYKNDILITNATTDNIKVDSIGSFLVIGKDMNNCMSSDSIMVINENSDTIVVTSNILTPNGDGINDELKIFNISAYSNCELDIYNMWNEKVYSVMHYNNDWKGTNSSGANLPAGPYYYIIKCDDKPMLKGNINILR